MSSPAAHPYLFAWKQLNNTAAQNFIGLLSQHILIVHHLQA